jgi:t-SNARE complex subunit (syntaxin)
MFAEMAQIVEAQEPVVQRTEENAVQTAEDVKRGNVEIDKANEHARRRNRLKWWCLLVVVRMTAPCYETNYVLTNCSRFSLLLLSPLV